MANLYRGPPAQNESGEAPVRRDGTRDAYHIPSVLKRILGSEEGQAVANNLTTKRPNMTHHQVEAQRQAGGALFSTFCTWLRVGDVCWHGCWLS